MSAQSSVFENSMIPMPKRVSPYRLASGSDPEDGASKPVRSARASMIREDLPYIIELWDAARTGVEQVLAVTAHGSIGYAAYYAATREYPDRYITLRHRNRTVARSNSPQV